MEKKIKKSIDEFVLIFDDIATSDLQGLCDFRAMEIVKSRRLELYAPVSELILSGIYKKIDELEKGE